MLFEGEKTRRSKNRRKNSVIETSRAGFSRDCKNLTVFTYQMVRQMAAP